MFLNSITDNEIVLSKINRQYEVIASVFSMDSFMFQQAITEYDSTMTIIIGGKGKIYGDSISFYYRAGGELGKFECNCKGVRKNATLINQVVGPGSAFLFQNTPNPFSHETEIKYYVPENADNAVLYVFSLQGNMLLTKQISQLGNGSITISASELQPGMYIYTLAVDGQEADSKRMIITEE